MHKSGFAALVGNPRPGSRTASVSKRLLNEVAGISGHNERQEMVDLGRLLESNGAPMGAGARERYVAPISSVSAARVLVVASPTYKATYTGLLKSFLDLFDGGALRGTVAIPVMTVGAATHYMAVGMHLAPLLVEMGATVPASPFVVQESQFGDVASLVTDWISTNEDVISRFLR